MSEIVTDAGHEVRLARNGSEALTALATDPLPQLIFLDLMMPKMDGAQFRERQLRDPRLCEIPVVLLSAVHDLARQANALRVTAFLPKPTTPDKVLEAVERFAAP